MEKREIAQDIKKQPYFKATTTTPVLEQDDGTREMGRLYPFLICGGRNTERYYFTHINDTTKYKFNIKPKYFNDESNYTEAFPKRIKEILTTNKEAKIFCVFDWDTVYDNEKKLKQHKAFEKRFVAEIKNGTVAICPSMPSIEYWFLLHFTDYTKLLKNYRDVSNILAPHLKPYFANPKTTLKKLLKSEKHLKDAGWVQNLCADEKLDKAIKRAKENIDTAISANKLEEQSYSYIYKIFLR